MKPFMIFGIIILIAGLSGCTSKDSKMESEQPNTNNFTMDQIILEQNGSMNNNTSTENQLRLLLQFKDFNKTGNLPVIINIMNPRLNETVLYGFRTEFGQEWYNTTNTTTIVNNNWKWNYSREHN